MQGGEQGGGSKILFKGTFFAYQLRCLSMPLNLPLFFIATPLSHLCKYLPLNLLFALHYNVVWGLRVFTESWC